MVRIYRSAKRKAFSSNLGWKSHTKELYLIYFSTEGRVGTGMKRAQSTHTKRISISLPFVFRSSFNLAHLYHSVMNIPSVTRNPS